MCVNSVNISFARVISTEQNSHDEVGNNDALILLGSAFFMNIHHRAYIQFSET